MSQISSLHPSTLSAGSLTLEVAHLLWETDGVWMWGGSVGTGGVSSVSSGPALQYTDERSTEAHRTAGACRAGGPCSVPGPTSPPGHHSDTACSHKCTHRMLPLPLFQAGREQPLDFSLDSVACQFQHPHLPHPQQDPSSSADHLTTPESGRTGRAWAVREGLLQEVGLTGPESGVAESRPAGMRLKVEKAKARPRGGAGVTGLASNQLLGTAHSQPLAGGISGGTSSSALAKSSPHPLEERGSQFQAARSKPQGLC